jgi:hypothetical protein
MSIAEKAKEGTQARFVEYKDGELWYRTEPGFEYPVPAKHPGEAAQLAHAQAMQFLR